MSDYYISQIRPDDKPANQQLDLPGREGVLGRGGIAGLGGIPADHGRRLFPITYP